MPVSYVSAGSSPRASQLNSLTAELNAIISAAFNGRSWLCYEQARNTNWVPLLGYTVFLGDPAARRILSPWPEAASSYDHSVYTAIAAGMTIDLVDESIDIAYTEAGQPWPLDGSLEAHTVLYQGPSDPAPRPYWLCNRDAVVGRIVEGRERYRKLDPLDVVFEAMPESSFAWPANWNKYHCIRFHNLDPGQLTVVLPGGVDLVIPPFSVRTVRRSYPLGTTYLGAFDYLWTAQSGDSLIFDAFPPNNVSSLLTFHNWLDALVVGGASGGPNRQGVYLHPAIGWDGSALLPRPIDTSARLGEYLFHLGEILSIQAADTHDATISRGTPASWAELESAAGVAGVRAVIGTGAGALLTMQAAADTVPPVDAMGPGTNTLPVRPFTLPVDLSHGSTALGAPGCKPFIGQFSASYLSDQNPFPDIVVLSDTYETSQTSSGWRKQDSVGGWSTLTHYVDLVVLEEESTAKPAFAWRSDAWHMYAYGTVFFPTALTFDLNTAETVLGWPFMRLATVTEAGVTVPVGGPAYDRGGWFFTGAREGRRISPYVGFTDAFNQVYHEGHPDIAGTYGLPDGLDWTEDRGVPEPALVHRTELVPEQVPTWTLPVNARSDQAERIIQNVDTPGWYGENRDSILAGETTKEDRQGIVRAPILREHFNQIAGRLNSVQAIKPWLFETVVWYGQVNDGPEIGLNNDRTIYKGQLLPTGSNYPAGFYCAVLPTGSRAAALGIPIYFTTSRGATMYWIRVDDTAAKAAELGFQFRLRRLIGFRRMTGTPTNPQWWSDTSAASAWKVIMPHSPRVAGCYSFSDQLGLVLPASHLASATAPLIHWEVAQMGANLPAGWGWNTDDRFMTQAQPAVSWESQSMGEFSFFDPVEAIAAAVVAPRSFALAESPLEGFTVASIAALLEITLPDPRCTFQIIPILRDVLVRT